VPLGLTALTWVILIPCTLCWPAAGFLVYVVHRSAKRHDERERLEREQALAASEPS
jgi:hypothetical protein